MVVRRTLLSAIPRPLPAQGGQECPHYAARLRPLLLRKEVTTVPEKETG